MFKINKWAFTVKKQSNKSLLSTRILKHTNNIARMKDIISNIRNEISKLQKEIVEIDSSRSKLEGLDLSEHL